MTRETGIYKRPDSRYWWINVTLPNGKHVRKSTWTEDQQQALALLSKMRLDAFKEVCIGLKPERTWTEAVTRYLVVKSSLRSYRDVERQFRKLAPYLSHLSLLQINGDVIWQISQGELTRGCKPATVNRCLAALRSVLRMARDEWQWIDSVPRVRLLHGEVERDFWLTHEQARQLIAACPSHLAALVRFALATGCRAREITGLEWSRVDLERQTIWLNQTKNGTPRGVPLNRDALILLEQQQGKDQHYCFVYRGKPIRHGLTNTAWQAATKAVGLEGFRFHDLRHTWASWHRQAGTSCDELKELGGWKSRTMVDRYAKYATEHLAAAASRIELPREESNVVRMSRFCHAQKPKRASV